MTQTGQTAAVGRWLRSEIGVPFVVVGGSAVEQVVPVATKHVDVLIKETDWPTVDSALESRRDASPLDPDGGSIRGTFVSIDGLRIELEFIAGEPFSGRSDRESFGRYVSTAGSTVHDDIRYATPAVVFYMRLNAPDDWQLYIPAIERDLQAGVSVRTLDQACRIADRFGVGPEVRGRVKSLRATLRALDIRRG
ncbi:MAG: hypothetical protein WBF81_05680 [Thermoplasmata archaeon]